MIVSLLLALFSFLVAVAAVFTILFTITCLYGIGENIRDRNRSKY